MLDGLTMDKTVYPFESQEKGDYNDVLQLTWANWWYLSDLFEWKMVEWFRYVLNRKVKKLITKIFLNISMF